MLFYRQLKAVSAPSLILILLVGILPTIADACITIYPKMKVGGSSFEQHFFSFVKSDFGPALLENDESFLVYNAKQKKWCYRDFTKADSVPNCELFYKPNSVISLYNKDKKTIGVVLISETGVLTLHSVKATNDKITSANYKQMLDSTKPSVEVATGESKVTGDESKLELTFSAKKDGKTLGKANLSMTGKLQADGTLDYKRFRSLGTDRLDSNATDLVGNSIEGPEQCGASKIQAYSAAPLPAVQVAPPARK